MVAEMAKQKTLAGASLKMLINNTVFGICTNFEFTSAASQRVIAELDSPVGAEIASGLQSVEGRIECLRLRLDGGLEGRGIAPPDEDIMLAKYITITLIDRLSDAIVFQTNKASVDGQTWKTDARGVMRGSFSFKGLGWINENAAST